LECLLSPAELHDVQGVDVAGDEGVAAPEVVVDDDGDPDLEVPVPAELAARDGEDGRLVVRRELADDVGGACNVG
jgi:hypothetical protein